MEIWIRSQDKLNLILVSRLTIAKEISMVGCKNINADKFTIRTMYNHTTSDRYFESLGSYKNKERALEVLDDIQLHISIGVRDVFKMPQE